MPDPYRSYSKGEPIPKDRETLNAFAYAARYARDRKNNKLADSPEVFRQGSVIRVKNESGRALGRNSVLGLGPPIFLPRGDPQEAHLNSFLKEVTFRGTIPTSAHRGRFCVTLDPCDIGRIGRAYVDGVCQARINVKSPSHTCADVEENSTSALVSMDNGGSARILWAEGGKGEQWGIVRIGAGCRVCCTSSSSSSSSQTSHHCPTSECKEGCGPTPVTCTFHVSAVGVVDGDPSIGFCAQVNGDFYVQHVSGCTWFAAFGGADGLNQFPSTCTMSFAGGLWTIEIIDQFGDVAIYTSSDFTCKTPTIFDFQSTNCRGCDPCPPRATVTPIGS